MTEIKFPELGEGIERAIVSCIHAKVGDQLQVNDDVVELTTDKATFNVSSENEGVLKEIYVKEREEVVIGQTLALIE